MPEQTNNLLDQLGIVQSTLGITIEKLKTLNLKIGEQDNEYNEIKTAIALMAKDLEDNKKHIDKHCDLIDRELVTNTAGLKTEIALLKAKLDTLENAAKEKQSKQMQWTDRKIVLFVAFIGFVGTLIGAILGVYAQKWIK